jgi:GMP synthase (glutamine-hydrolysing)
MAGTVIFGGKQAAEGDANCPYLQEELRWIADCRAADLPMLGICLGAQLIIRSLGGRVGALNGDFHEFGYFRVEPTPRGKDFLPGPLHVTEAHYHTFTLPDGVELLATGQNYVNQAFRYGPHIYGVQFHPVCTIEIFRRWQTSDWAPYGRPGVQDLETQNRLMAEHDATQSAWFNGFLGKLFKSR